MYSLNYFLSQFWCRVDYLAFLFHVFLLFHIGGSLFAKVTISFPDRLQLDLVILPSISGACFLTSRMSAGMLACFNQQNTAVKMLCSSESSLH